MSRLSEIIENHRNLDDLFSLLKHYSVNAQFVADSVILKFDQTSEDEDTEKDDKEDKEADEEGQYPPELLEDLKQFYARL